MRVSFKTSILNQHQLYHTTHLTDQKVTKKAGEFFRAENDGIIVAECNPICEND